jgi:hypothetical protein
MGQERNEELVLDRTNFPVEKLTVRQSGDVLWLFVSAVQAKAILLASENIEGFSALCREFQFRNLSRRLEVFKNTPTYRLEQRFNALKAKVQSFCNRVSSLETAERPASPALTRLPAS